jgi:hypothetical protein
VQGGGLSREKTDHFVQRRDVMTWHGILGVVGVWCWLSSVAIAVSFMGLGGMVGLGDLTGGSYSSQALGVSANGLVAVGRGPSNAGEEAFIWDHANGMRSLQDVLANSGIDMTGWQLEIAFDVSADGKTIVGYGDNPNGNREAWRAAIPEPSTLFLCILALGVVGGWRLHKYLIGILFFRQD